MFTNKNINIYNRTCKVLFQALLFTLFSFKLALSQEITAIDFNGDLIGKVIPDGKVVSFDNKLIGNINADSLIIDFDGKLIGGIVPQGVAIGNDNKFLGKVNTDGTVRVPSGKVVGKTLPNGFVIDEFYEIIGSVLFPGLIYSDEGKTVGRLIGDGSYTNLQGQRIGFVSSDGYAYRKVGSDYVLDGKLISSRMVVSTAGEFIGSVSPGGEVTNFATEVIGRIKANGFAYDESNNIIGRIVSSGYAFDIHGKYIGFVNYNGEVVNKEQLIGKITLSGDVVDSSNKVIGYFLDFSTTYTDMSGKYLGRLNPDGKIVKVKDIIAEVASKDIVKSEEVIVGVKVSNGPVFDYKGTLVAHAQKNGSVVLFEGSSIGSVKGNFAYNKSGYIIGGTVVPKLSVGLGNKVLGISEVNSSITSSDDKLKVSPLGYVFSSSGSIVGETINTGSIYLNGNNIASLSPNGQLLSKGSVIGGKIISSGIALDANGKVLGKVINSLYVVGSKGERLGYISNINTVYNNEGKIVGRILEDDSVVSASSVNSKDLMPRIGQSYEHNVVVGVNGAFIGYAGVDGVVRDTSNSVIGQVIDRGMAINNNNGVLGELVPYSVALSENCEVLGVVTTRGDVRNTKDTYIGRVLFNGQVISDSGSVLGYIATKGVIINNVGGVLGFVSSDGKILDDKSANIGCVKNNGLFKNQDGSTLGKVTTISSVINFDGKIIGRTNSFSEFVNNDGSSAGYVQVNNNVNSKTGVPLGNVFAYKYAFNNSNKFLGIVLSDASILGADGKKINTVDFNGQIGKENFGYALYDLYVYDNDGKAIGYIAPDGNALSFAGQNIGKIDKGFVIDKTGKVIARGNRDFNIRNEINVIIGELALDGNLVDLSGKTVGQINTETGLISDESGTVIARAHILQYYGKSIGIKEVYDEYGRVIGYANEDGTVVDENGKVIALLNENGLAVSASGDIIGGTGTDWFEKTPKAKRDDRNIEVGVIDTTIQDKARRSLSVALTPDGEFLGNILDDGRVIDKDGNVIGRKMPDGLIVDDSGSLIGIEEISRPDFTGGGIFVPPGAYGQNAAYGTGSGPGGNLGPGGGYGPGERYDPQRAAALAAAQDERRKNISVGKISTHVKKSNFDGMQDNWDEQGMPKSISSWRVDMSEMILADKPIPAVIARSIDSNNPTPVTAIVERNVYAEEGRNIIIPAGSRLLGTLAGLTGSTEGVTNSAKVQINWERLIRPDGSMFAFGGLTGDAQGRGGALGYLDQQLFKKYSLPLMTTALKSAAAYVMAPSGSGGEGEGSTETPRQQAASDARESFLTDMKGIFDKILQDRANIKPLTYVPAGTRIVVYPTVDLWLRTPERDELEAAAGMASKEVLIDDKTAKGKEKEREIEKKTSGGSVVYEADDGDVEAQGQGELLLDDRKESGKRKSTGATPPPPPPPPPPPSGSSTPTQRQPAVGSSKPKESSGTVPQLF